MATVAKPSYEPEGDILVSPLVDKVIALLSKVQTGSSANTTEPLYNIAALFNVKIFAI
jgi:hypothetical protein